MHSLPCRLLLSVLQRHYPLQDPPEAGRFKDSVKAQPDPAAREMLMQKDFHLGVLNCALEVAVYVLVGGAPHLAFPWATRAMGRDCCTLSLWHAIK